MDLIVFALAVGLLLWAALGVGLFLVCCHPNRHHAAPFTIADSGDLEVGETVYLEAVVDDLWSNGRGASVHLSSYPGVGTVYVSTDHLTLGV